MAITKVGRRFRSIGEGIAVADTMGLTRMKWKGLKESRSDVARSRREKIGAVEACRNECRWRGKVENGKNGDERL